jgi:tetratricopeptide (TPR) repeat protein
MRQSWWPGRRKRILDECYDIGYVARQNGANDLAKVCFNTGIAALDGRRPSRAKASLATFSVAAACHNHLGLQYLDEHMFAEAAASFDSAISIRQELRRLFPKDRENEIYLGGALCNRGHASAGDHPEIAKAFYERCLSTIRQPTQPCECSYWDEQRQSWWCEQLEALGQALNQQWVALAPYFIDNAQAALDSLKTNGRTKP